MLISSAKKLLRHWKPLCACVSIIFLINVLYLVSQVHRNKPGETLRKQSSKLVARAISLKGVGPGHVIHKLVNSSSMFTCIDRSKSVKLTAFNDDFCDCLDGSDEPGTNACNNGQFYCSIEEKFIHSSYVNDGICDCCDGQDEWRRLEPNFILPLKYPTKRFVPCSNICACMMEKAKLQKKKQWFDNIKYEYMVAGLSGGVISTMVLHPLDLIKIRFQVNDGTGLIKHRQTYNGVVDAFRSILKSNGIKGLYQGVSPNLAGAGSSWGLYFFSFNFCKSSLKDFYQVESLSPKNHLLAGTLAGVFTLSLTNPIWVVKTRMCLQTSSSAKEIYYTGVLDGLKKLYQAEGIRGYYRGFVPGLFGVSHGALQFMAYEEFKKMRSQYTGQPVESKLNPLEYIAMAALSKVFAVVSTYPYQVIRSRLQDAQYLGHYSGTIDTFQKILGREGLKGFYKGMFPSLLRCYRYLMVKVLTRYVLIKSNSSMLYHLLGL